MKRKSKIFLKKSRDPHLDIPVTDRGDFPDFMRKEIFTQPQLIEKLCEKYIWAEKIHFEHLKIKAEKIRRIYIASNACDYGAALSGAYNFEVLADIPCAACLLSEFNFSNPILDKNTLVILISASKDDMPCSQARIRAEKSGAKIVGIYNCEQESEDSLSLDFIENAAVSTAAYTLRYTVLTLLALYIGEKNQVITELYIRIATKMLMSLNDKIKYILENEYLIRHISSKISCENLVLTGTNVDLAAAGYAAYLFSFAFGRDVRAFAAGQINSYPVNKSNVIGLASNENFYAVLNDSVQCRVHIIPKSIPSKSGDFIDYDDSIPLFNPLLGSVVCQLMAYNIAKNNNTQLEQSKSGTG